MKSITTYLIIILSLLLLAAGSLYLKERSERIRFEDNYETVVKDKERAEILHKGELKECYTEIDTLRKKLNIRDKTIEVVYQTEVNYKDSNLLIPVPVKFNVYDTIPVFAKKYSVKKPCYDLELLNINDTIIERLHYHNKYTGFLHRERPHKFWFVRWGSWEYFLKLYSHCENDTIGVDKLILYK